MIFRLYSAASGGPPLWEEQWTGSNSVRVSDGLFNVMLGSLAPIPPSVVTGNSSLWLGITVGSDDEMAPRVQLGSVPYAVQALRALRVLLYVRGPGGRLRPSTSPSPERAPQGIAGVQLEEARTADWQNERISSRGRKPCTRFENELWRAQQLVTHKGEELPDGLSGVITDVAFDNVAVTAIVEVLGERCDVTPPVMWGVVVTVEITGCDQPAFPMIGIAPTG
ncbi:MAG: hypothetical protein M5U01_29540 [Ardenticatenaceae bacterium]|nr:hypothetical protein [Ardenticatenaceae bacterium]